MKKKQEHFRRLLENKEKELKQRIEHLEEAEQLGGLQDATSELSMYDNHPADIGSETYERSKDIALRDFNTIQLEQVRAALERIEQGDYGRCQHCERAIDEERLEVMPEADLCLSCQEKAEGELDQNRSAVTPEPGFRQNDFREHQVQDDADAWQAVAAYGTSSELVDPQADPDDNWSSEGREREDVEAIPYRRDRDGVFYQDFQGRDDESLPGGPV